MEKLLWVDLEMTGLDVEKERIIEVAAIITDKDYHELARYHAVVQQPKSLLDKMDDWNQEHHGKSGLLAKIPDGKKEKQVETELLRWMAKHFDLNGPKTKRPILCGNSIYQDKRFISKYWPRMNDALHYRVLDVSSFKVVFNGIHNVQYEKKNCHQAMEDILESIGELKHYMEYVRF
ncbi:MAG: oligoribonuclease [Bdellovibrionales bacterium]